MTDWQKCFLAKELKLSDLMQMVNNDQLGIVAEIIEDSDLDVFIPLVGDVEEKDFVPPERSEEAVVVQNVVGELFNDIMCVRREEGSNECYADFDELI